MQGKRKQMSRILLGSFLLLLSNLAFAKWYQVEMLVFENLQLNSDGEIWDTGRVQDYSQGLELLVAHNAKGVFEELSSAKYRMLNIKKKLKLSATYRPIYHISWQQPSLTKSSARKVRIKSSEAKIDGTVNLISGRLLHIDIDISYFINATTGITEFIEDGIGRQASAIVSHTKIAEIRRIKLNELHYFDHPLFGVLIQVTRLEVEE